MASSVIDADSVSGVTEGLAAPILANALEDDSEHEAEPEPRFVAPLRSRQRQRPRQRPTPNAVWSRRAGCADCGKAVARAVDAA